MLWNVEISDSVFYPEIEADTEDEAIDIAYNWFHERIHEVFIEQVKEKKEK